MHCGVLRGKAQTRAELGLPPVRWVQALDRADYRFAPASGLYENCVELGEAVRRSDILGLVHSLEQPDCSPAAVVAHSDGVLVSNRGPSIVSQGDCVACLAHDTDPRNLA